MCLYYTTQVVIYATTVAHKNFVQSKFYLALCCVLHTKMLRLGADCAIFRIDTVPNGWYNLTTIPSKRRCIMSTKQDQILHFNVKFNSVLMNSQIPPAEKIPQILQLQKDFDILPNEQSKAIFALQSDLVLGDCYVKTHQKYMLTPIVARCKVWLDKLEEHDFATQPKKVWGYLAERFDGYYNELADLCQAKNHQRDVAWCYQEIARIYDRAGDEANCIKNFVLSNVALAKIPNSFALSKEQLLEQFPDHVVQISQIFDSQRGLKNDPIEQSEKYLSIYDEAERIIQGLIEQEGRLARSPDQYWNIKRDVLEFHFGIEWKSPRLMNPGVRF